MKNRKEYDKKRYYEGGLKERKKNEYKEKRKEILKKALSKTKTIPKEEVINIIDFWRNGMVGYNRHKNIYIFSDKEIKKLKIMIIKREFPQADKSEGDENGKR